MMRLSFSGGINPPENKHLTEGVSFQNLSIPQICYIPMQQHAGRPARVIVAPGENVIQGQMIGEADGLLSAHVHASIPGRVLDVGKHPTVYARDTECVLIELQGSFRSSRRDETPAWEAGTGEMIVSKIAAAGIVGLGGAAFPTHVKLQPPKNKPIDTLIVNGAESSPYLTADDMLMRSHPEQIITGVRMLLKALGIASAIIGIEDNKPAAAAALRTAIGRIGPPESIQVKVFKTRYPQGGERQLIYGALGRQVPSGGLPMDAGAVVQNVGTVYAVYEAVMFDKPLYERYVTVTGGCIGNPGNYKVRIGTRIADLVEECGGLTGKPAKVIMGGPLCGTALDSLEVPVTKGTSGILFLAARETPGSVDYLPCIRCGRCVAACPAGILPNMLGKAIEKERFDIAETLRPFDCIMCGSCAYICPARRPNNQFIRLAQEKLRRKNT
ncbi:MAG: electron transport complex subunit RsxC [Spirochaetes bacterium]|nr:MAG: electron transport complex subunit RsxC [Spirochaetota bacterium]